MPVSAGMRKHVCCLHVSIVFLLGAAAFEHGIMYGGAWKGPHAEQNVLDAVRMGYRSFDTANVYAASYNETAVGVALERARSAGVRREDIFIQTKFTPGISKNSCPDGPWNPEECMFDKNADLATQVKQSAQTSLAHLRVAQLDSLVLHEARQPWDDLLVIWRALEDLYSEGKAATIGLSHMHDPAVFRRLLAVARIKPSFVQNPIFAVNHWDKGVRDVCREHDIVFQAYSLNNVANDWVYHSGPVQQIARRLDRTPQQVIVAMTKRLGLLPLVGPQDPVKMAYAISAAHHLPQMLTDADVATLENLVDARENGKQIRRGSHDGTEVSLAVTNQMGTGVYFAWQHPDHTHERTKKGMHATPMLIGAGQTQQINSKHRHGFYLWDAAEGEVAPLHREDADKRWVRRIRADAFLRTNDLTITSKFEVVFVNLGLELKDIFWVNDEDGTEKPIGVCQGRGGQLKINTFDGHTFEIRDHSGEKRRVTVRRRDGDPQLLQVESISQEAAKLDREEL